MKLVKDHQIECLIGKTISSIHVGVLDTKNGNTQIIRIDHNEGTHWLVPRTFDKKQKEIVFDLLNHEQYAEFLEFHQE